MKTSENIAEIGKALSKMQGDMTAAKMKSVNPYFKSSYADLPAVWMAIRGPLSDNGLSVVQSTETHADGVSIVTRLIHVSGQWIEFGPLVIPVNKKDAQAVGSACSYGKRYAIGAALGVVAEKDDDGDKATKSVPEVVVREERKSVKPLPEVNVDDWVTTWSKKYDKNLILEYIKARSEHLKHNASVTVSQLASNSDLFEKNLKIWIANKEKDDSEK